MNRSLLVKKVIAKIAEKEVQSFNFLDWAKKIVKIPTKEEAIKILKDIDSKKIDEALKLLPSFSARESFSARDMSKIIILAAIFVLTREHVFQKIKNFDGSEIKQKIEKEIKDYEHKHNIKHNLVFKKDSPSKPKDIMKEKPVDFYKDNVIEGLKYIKEIETNLAKNKEKKLSEILKKDRSFFISKQKELSNLKGSDLESAMQTLRRNIDSYTGSVWFGFMDSISQGKTWDDSDRKSLEQKDNIVPEKMDWTPISK